MMIMFDDPANNCINKDQVLKTINTAEDLFNFVQILPHTIKFRSSRIKSCSLYVCQTGFNEEAIY
jgi:hypothetical protein